MRQGSSVRYATSVVSPQANLHRYRVTNGYDHSVGISVNDGPSGSPDAALVDCIATDHGSGMLQGRQWHKLATLIDRLSALDK